MTALVLFLLLGGGAGQGQTDSDFWARTLARSPEVERWLLEGDQRLQLRAEEQWRQAEQAFAEAARLAPRDPRVRQEHAQSLGLLGRYAEELQEWRAVRRLDDKLDPGGVAMALGVCLARTGEYAAAAQEYRRAIDARSDVTLGIAHWNLGDVEMALGHVEEALHQYQLALLAATSAGAGTNLEHDAPAIELALAVAHDRAGDEAQARIIARRAVARGALRVLGERVSQIFFVPPEDQPYTLALGNEVAGERVSALEQWTEYLQHAPNGPWLARARAHLDALLSETPRGGPVPSELSKCVAGRRLVAEVRLGGSSAAPAIRIFPSDGAADVQACLDLAARRLGGSGRYLLVGKLDSRSAPP